MLEDIYELAIREGFTEEYEIFCQTGSMKEKEKEERKRKKERKKCLYYRLHLCFK